MAASSEQNGRGYYGYGDGYYGGCGYASAPYHYSTDGSATTRRTRLVKVYDDAGEWVWGFRYYC